MLWSFVFVRNKSIKAFLIDAFKSIIHNNEKVIPSESGEKYAQIKHRLQAKTNSSKQMCG